MSRQRQDVYSLFGGRFKGKDGGWHTLLVSLVSNNCTIWLPDASLQVAATHTTSQQASIQLEKIKGCFSLLRAIFSVYHQLLWSFQLPQLLRTEKTGSPLTMSTALHEAVGDYFPTSCSSLSSYMLKWGVVQGVVGSNMTFLNKPWELICSRGAFFFF